VGGVKPAQGTLGVRRRWGKEGDIGRGGCRISGEGVEGLSLVSLTAPTEEREFSRLPETKGQDKRDTRGVDAGLWHHMNKRLMAGKEDQKSYSKAGVSPACRKRTFEGRRGGEKMGERDCSPREGRGLH